MRCYLVPKVQDTEDARPKREVEEPANHGAIYTHINKTLSEVQSLEQMEIIITAEILTEETQYGAIQWTH